MRNAAAELLLGVSNSTGLSITDDAFAMHMDGMDSLREHRALFHFPHTRDGEDFAYLVNQTLGLQHVGTEASVAAVMKKWREQASEGNFMQPNPWMEVDDALRKDMACLVGAAETEVAVMNSYTVNLHFMLTAFFRPKGAKKKIMCGNHAAPTNTHALSSQLEVHDLSPREDLVVVSVAGHEDWRAEPVAIPTQSYLDAIENVGNEVALLFLPAVHFLTGQLVDVAAITEAAHAKNILVGVDCSQAVGTVPLQLHDWNVDFACWSTYRFLSGGPGGVGAAFVNNKHTSSSESDSHYLKGWWGADRKSRFSMRHTFEPADGANMFEVSCANVLGIAALTPPLRLYASVGVDALYQKGQSLTAYMELLLNQLVPPGCIEIVTPVDPQWRGVEISFRIVPNRLSADSAMGQGYDGTGGGDGVDDAELMSRQLLDEGVMVEHRSHNMVRLAPSPIYSSYRDILVAVRAIGLLF